MCSGRTQGPGEGLATSALMDKPSILPPPTSTSYKLALCDRHGMQGSQTALGVSRRPAALSSAAAGAAAKE